MTQKIIRFVADGMFCENCEKIIKHQARKIKGVKNIDIDYKTQEGVVEFDISKTNIEKIFSKIEEKGYGCNTITGVPEGKQEVNPFAVIMIIAGILVAVYFLFNLFDSITFPQISQGMGYTLLFVVGLLTGLHCIAMCGGFVVSYTANDSQKGKLSHKSHLFYGAGKTLSYTMIGAFFGLIGSIFAFTPQMRGVAGILAGVFLLLFGLKMINMFPILRRLTIKTPRFITKIVGEKSKQSTNPLVIGLLNGLMIACGPLQAIYIMAAGTGSVIEGAKLLFVFGLGTLPAMLGFGYFASFISGKMTHKLLKASGAIVILLGVFMINNGLALTGIGYDFNSMIATVSAQSDSSDITANNNVAAQKSGYQEIRMDVNRDGWDPDKFVIKKGVPVKWIISGNEINGCNNAIQVPKYQLNFDIKRGEQVIEFTPDKEGVVSWSCWMGMIPGVFIVKEDTSNAQAALEEVEVPKGGSCGGGSGGGCGCGGRR
ncbi:hypothetical protein GOV08_04035 [Candidatus Woesearchaeota archaeon]|nr:hypothetical protein [Candidatus Woesearchaeota archaeon]